MYKTQKAPPNGYAHSLGEISVYCLPVIVKDRKYIHLSPIIFSNPSDKCKINLKIFTNKKIFKEWTKNLYFQFSIENIQIFYFLMTKLYKLIIF